MGRTDLDSHVSEVLCLYNEDADSNCVSSVCHDVKPSHNESHLPGLVYFVHPTSFSLEPSMF